VNNVKYLALIIVALLFFGCTQESTAVDNSRNVEVEKKTVCRDVVEQTSDCWKADYQYSAGAIKKEDPYKMDVYCIVGAKVEVANLEQDSGLFKVELTFSAPIEGKTTKIVEKTIGSKKSAVFEEQAQFRCAQEYSVDYRVVPPTKQACGLVNKTREECVVE
jgi:hypothetical protein